MGSDWQKTPFWISPAVNLVPEITNLDASFLKILLYGVFLAK
jgi:hypothetical protein